MLKVMLPNLAFQAGDDGCELEWSLAKACLVYENQTATDMVVKVAAEHDVVSLPQNKRRAGQRIADKARQK